MVGNAGSHGHRCDHRCHRGGREGAIILTAGLGRGDGSIGAAVLQLARQSGLRIVGPNCLGILSPRAALNASFAERLPKSGPLALISQSGAIATGIVAWALQRDIGLSGVVSLGDALDVDFGDCLDYFGEDAATRAILLYVEGIADTRKFMSAARKAARVKPVIVLKAGRRSEVRRPRRPTRAQWRAQTRCMMQPFSVPAACACQTSMNCLRCNNICNARGHGG